MRVSGLTNEASPLDPIHWTGAYGNSGHDCHAPIAGILSIYQLCADSGGLRVSGFGAYSSPPRRKNSSKAPKAKRKEILSLPFLSPKP